MAATASADPRSRANETREEDMLAVKMHAVKLVPVGAALLAATIFSFASLDAAHAQGAKIDQATLGETNQKTGEVSTDELRRILADGSAIVLDSRKRSEYVAGHIAGAKNVSPPASAPPSAYASAVEQLVGGDKGKALLLYCNGPHCQASRLLSDQLVADGFTNVRRYQLGIPFWRAFSGPVEIELEGVERIYKVDGTVVWFDARSAAEFAKGSLAGAHSVPADQVAEKGLGKAPLPRDDFNTRVVLFGHDGAQARKLADAIGKTPYQNVSYFPGTYDALAKALAAK
jgi:rhodanese-related sulfurtransferase